MKLLHLRHKWEVLDEFALYLPSYLLTLTRGGCADSKVTGARWVHRQAVTCKVCAIPRFLELGTIENYEARRAAGEQLPREVGRPPLTIRIDNIEELLDQVTRLRALLEEHMERANVDRWCFCKECAVRLHAEPGYGPEPHLADCLFGRTRAELGETQQEGK